MRHDSTRFFSSTTAIAAPPLTSHERHRRTSVSPGRDARWSERPIKNAAVSLHAGGSHDLFGTAPWDTPISLPSRGYVPPRRSQLWMGFGLLVLSAIVLMYGLSVSLVKSIEATLDARGAATSPLVSTAAPAGAAEGGESHRPAAGGAARPADSTGWSRAFSPMGALPRDLEEQPLWYFLD